MASSIEDFCWRGLNQIIAAQGSALSIVTLDGAQQLKKANDYYPFQKPVSRVRYDGARDRVIAGGLDCQLKFFSITDESELSVAYKIKVPSEIFALDISADGNHFSMGLSDGSLVIKSKMLEPLEEVKTDEQRLFDQFEPKMISTSKNYKYFYRGQYLVTADPDDIQAPMTGNKRRKRVKLQAYEQHLKRFEYRQALNAALESRNPEVILSLIEELVERDALYNGIGGRSEDELVKLLDFLIWKMPDHRFAPVLLEVARITLDMYAGVVGLSDRYDNKLFNQLTH